MSDLTNRLAAMHARLDRKFDAFWWSDQRALLSAVDGVLTVQPKPEGPFRADVDDAYIDGYNEALRVVRKALTDALGVGA